MQRPRRTTEYETPSEKARQSRPSRLQQPIRRPSIRRDGSLTRSSSAEPLNYQAAGGSNHLAVPTSTKRQRSSSVSNARTPQRTPTHITPSRAPQFTAEKQRAPINDKRWIQEQVLRITEYLKTVDCGIPTDFLNRGGLKTMSMKQFIGLVNFFLKRIAGNKFTVGANHVESISKILNLIDYPYTVNKSWLKTPTAPHAFGNAVMMFSFFMEFIPPSENIEFFKKNYLIVSEEFPDMEFAIKMSNMAEEGFTLWNNQKNEDFEKLQKIAMDELLYKRISIPSAEAFEEEIQTLIAKRDELFAKKVVIEEDEFCRLDKEVKTNERKIEKLLKGSQVNQKTMNELKSQVSTQMGEIKKLRSKVEDLLNVVNTQEVSVDERNKLIEEVGQMQFILKTKKQAVCDLQEMDNQSQILLSRHIKQLTEKIAKFNSYIRQIMMDFEDLEVDIESLCLHQNTEIDVQDQIDEIQGFLKKLQRHITNRIEELSKRTDAYMAQYKLISFEVSEFIEPKSVEITENIKDHQNKLDDLDREIIAVKNFTTNRLGELSQKVKESEVTLKSLKDSIEKNREEISKTTEENQAMMAVVSERFEEFFTTKEKQLKRFQEVMQQLQKKIAEAKALIK